MKPTDLRIALFSGNYNYVRDGANQALNRLVGYLLRRGCHVRIYSATSDTPAFPPAGDLVSVPSISIPGRGEYRVALGLPGATRRDLEGFAPNIIHVSAPDVMNHRAVSFARARGIPILASLHTRFETYFQYYGLGWVVPAVEVMQRRFYRRCTAVVAPSASLAKILRDQRMNADVGIWARGIDTSIFNAAQRDLVWRSGLGIGDDEVVIGFLGRLVMEKGLDVFADSIDALKARNTAHRVLVIGDGPARDWFAKRLPGAVFVGFQKGQDLGRAVASLDVLFNPSITEAFGNVTLEVMACRLPVVAARATGSEDIVKHGITGQLIAAGDAEAFANALQAYCNDLDLRDTHGRAGETESRNYDWDRVNQTVLDTYLKLAK